jgi:type III secretion protein C
VFSGTPESLARAHQLVQDIDTPMRQVLIEMLILETTLEDSLEFGVSYATRFAGGDLVGAQTFYSGTSPIIAAVANTGLSGLGQAAGNIQKIFPNAPNVGQNSGFNIGVIGQKITHCGKEFGSLGALVHALHDRTRDKVVSNPKLLVEDNAPAELFVGINTPYRTQSISNDFGSVITSNFEYRDIGTRLKITPYLGNSDIIALDIEEEVSTIIAGLITNADTANTSPGPTTRLNRTTTRVHIPDNYFLIISGMMQNEEARERNQIPCLGGVPILGAAFSDKRNHDLRRNLMIFIRPKIIDTEEEIQTITKHEQDIYDYKNCLKNSDEYETSEALDLFNIRRTFHPEDVYECECDCN